MSIVATFLVLEYVGIILLIYLFAHCAYHRINYTLQIICIVAIFNCLNETILIFCFDTQVIERAWGTNACIVSAVFEQYIPLTLNLLATSMSFNLWFLIVRKSNYTERSLLKWYCLFSFGLPLILVTITLIHVRNEHFMKTYARQFYCDFLADPPLLGSYAIPMVIFAIPGILLNLHTVLFLIKHQLKLRRTLNSGTSSGSRLAMELSHCIRLVVFCIFFGSVILMAMMGRILDVQRDGIMSYDRNDSAEVFSDFSGSLVAYFLFIVFGTTRASAKTFAVLFCPCRKRNRVARSGRMGSSVDDPASAEMRYSNEEPYTVAQTTDEEAGVPTDPQAVEMSTFEPSNSRSYLVV